MNPCLRALVLLAVLGLRLSAERYDPLQVGPETVVTKTFEVTCHWGHVAARDILGS